MGKKQGKGRDRERRGEELVRHITTAGFALDGAHQAFAHEAHRMYHLHGPRDMCGWGLGALVGVLKHALRQDARRGNGIVHVRFCWET